MNPVRPSDRERMLLARLLGSDQPEVTCEACFELLDRYVDLQAANLDADAALPGFREHLANCPACHEDYESLRELLSTD